MAAVAFWRAGLMLKMMWGRFGFPKNEKPSAVKVPGQEFVKE
jgi:hypothetical protein